MSFTIYSFCEAILFWPYNKLLVLILYISLSNTKFPSQIITVIINTGFRQFYQYVCLLKYFGKNNETLYTFHAKVFSKFELCFFLITWTQLLTCFNTLHYQQIEGHDVIVLIFGRKLSEIISYGKNNAHNKL